MVEFVAALVRAVQHAGVVREPGNGERRIGRRRGQGLRSAVARGECIGVEDTGLVRADKELAVVRRPGVAAREGVRRRREECLGIVAVWSRRSGRRIGRRGGPLAVPAGRAAGSENERRGCGNRREVQACSGHSSIASLLGEPSYSGGAGSYQVVEAVGGFRSGERRVGKEVVSTGRFWWWA